MMPPTLLFEREKQELEAIWASGIFSRAPNLGLVLKYVCSKYFDGTAEEIKEYNIAVEALGRPAEFDQKKDSIVRVEAHRLRKRLKEYYENEGAAHAVHIEIPSGQYTPKFIVRSEPGEPKDPESELSSNALVEFQQQAHSLSVIERELPMLETHSVSLTPAPISPGVSRHWRVFAPIAGLVLIAALIATLRYLPTGTAPPVHAAEVAPAWLPGDEIRIMSGAEQGTYEDFFERTWQSDRFFTGGYVASNPRPHPVIGTRDQRLYQKRREGSFRYDIPLTPGPHEMRLYMAETMYGENNAAGGAESTRIFNLSINGKAALSDFDVISDAGAGVADVKVFRDVLAAADGQVHLDFAPINNPAFVNAIEIVPGLPGRMRPVRIVARESGMNDKEGHHWDPDRYARSGQLAARPESNVSNAKNVDPEIFRSERYGNLTYPIPVARPGRYTVTLYFAENWFGPGMPGGGNGIGARIFDVLLNGVVIRHNFDIFKEAGGPGKAVIVSVNGVEPNHQGKIVISMPPAVNYACINALEIRDEANPVTGK